MSHLNHYPEESYALTEHGQLHDTNKYHAARYQDGSSIDWLYEEALERERTQAQRSQHGVRGLLLPWIDSARMWLVVILTGIGIGLAGAWLDVLVKWYVAFLSCFQAMKLSRLGDLREGRCTYGFFYNQNTCCSGLDRTRPYVCSLRLDLKLALAGELCREWRAWSEVFNIRFIFVQSLLHSFIYVSLAVSNLDPNCCDCLKSILVGRIRWKRSSLGEDLRSIVSITSPFLGRRQ